MFDWARGSMLKQLVERKMYFSDYKKKDWLKNWHTPWLLGLIELTPDMCVLDVGSAAPHFMQHVHKTYGCEVHALDAGEYRAGRSEFGLPTEGEDKFPEVTKHVGLAGQDLLPAEKFDLVTCISTLEHTYDHDSPLLPERPMPHLHALRDMSRMLKPGGMLLMNWDVYLDNMPQHFGYDFEMDYHVLQASGMRLASHRRRLRNAMYLFSHPDSLFVDPAQILQFKVGQARRGTAINMLWQKPGSISQLRLSPHPELEPFYFPDDETRPDPELSSPPDAASHEHTTAEIDNRFRLVISRIVDVLGRTDVGERPV